MMRRFLLTALFAVTAGLVPGIASASEPPVNYFGETSPLIDVCDPVADDRGPGYYTYPLDKTIRRGTFDLKRFTVYEEGDVVVFSIQMREYIKTALESGRRGDGEEQGFVMNSFDIYIDTDRKRGSGWNKALPGRDLMFSDGMGWEKMILVTPLSQFYAYNIIKDKTDEIGFQDMVPDIILPDYVQVQRDRIIIRISKDLLGAKPGPDWGVQCLAMGFSRVVSPNRLLNMDVKSFATPKDFGGGWDTYGDPPVIDMIVPGDVEDADRRQYDLLKAYRSEPYRGEIEYAMVPFVYGREKPAAAPGSGTPKEPAILAEPPIVRPPTPQTQPPSLILPDDVPAPVKKPVTAPAKPVKSGNAVSPASTDGFLPIRKAAPSAGAEKTGTTAPASGSFQPLKKKSDAPTGFMPIRKAPPTAGE